MGERAHDPPAAEADRTELFAGCIFDLEEASSLALADDAGEVEFVGGERALPRQATAMRWPSGCSGVVNPLPNGEGVTEGDGWRVAPATLSRSHPSATSSPARAIFFFRSSCSSACTNPRCRDGNDTKASRRTSPS